MVEKVEKIWMDGEFVNWDDANVHILTHTLHYGVGAFEGIRSYRRDDGTSVIFRLEEHIMRLLDSLKIVMLKCPFDVPTLVEACTQSLALNRLPEGYVRPLAYVGDGAMGLYAPDNRVRVAIISWKWGTYLGDGALENGIRAQVSSFNRNFVNSCMVKGKVVGHYVNSIPRVCVGRKWREYLHCQGWTHQDPPVFLRHSRGIDPGYRDSTRQGPGL